MTGKRRGSRPKGRPEPAPMRSRASSVALWGVVAVTALSPVVVGTAIPLVVNAKRVTADVFSTPKLALLLVLSSVSFAAWLAAVLLEKRPVRLAKPHALLGAFVVLAAVSTALSVHPATAFLGSYGHREGLIAVAAYAVIAFLTTQVITTRQELRTLSIALTVGLSLVVAQGVLQHFGYYADAFKLTAFRRPFSTLGNPNFLGALLVLAMPIVTAVALTTRSLAGRIGAWLVFWLTFDLWIGLSVRAAWIGGLVALASMSICAWRKRIELRSIDAVAAGVGVLGALGVVSQSILNPTYTSLVTRVASVADMGERNNASRLLLWKLATRVIRDHPLVGTGLSTTQYTAGKYETPELVRMGGSGTMLENVHNQALSLLAYVGIPAGVLCIAFVLWTFAASFRQTFASSQKRAGEDLTFAAYWAGSVGFVVALFFGFTTLGTAPVFFVACGLLLVPSATTRTLDVSPAVARGLLALAGVIALLATVFAFVLVAADVDYLRGRSSGTSGERIAHYTAAVDRMPLERLYRDELAYEKRTAFGQAASEALQDPAKLEVAKRLLEPAVSSTQEAIDFSPEDHLNHLRLAGIYVDAATVLNDSTYYDKAIEEARAARDLAPSRVTPLVREAIAHVRKEDYAAAETLLNRALALDPSYPDTYLTLSRIYYRRGDKQRALETLLKGMENAEESDGIAAALDALRSEMAAGANAP